MDRVTQEEFWAKVPHWVVLHPDLDAFAIRVYCVLSKHAHNSTRQAFPGTRMIAKEGHMARNTVLRALIDLEAVEALVITKENDGRHRKVNHYFLPMFKGGSPHEPPSREVVHPMSHPGSPGEPEGGSPHEPELDPSELDERTRKLALLSKENPRRPKESRSAYIRRLSGMVDKRTPIRYGDGKRRRKEEMTDSQCPYRACMIEGHGPESELRHYAKGWEPYADTPVIVIRELADVTAEVIYHAAEAAEATYGLNYDFRIDWDRAYGMLEDQHGWSMEEWDSPADRKIRREVNKLRRSEGLATASVED